MSIYFEIQVEDIERAKRFYQTLFGWRFQPAEGLPIEYWRIDTGYAKGGLLKRPAATPPSGHGTNAYVCSFPCDDIDRATETILSLGGKIALPKMDVPDLGAFAYYLDTEGNTFGLYQTV